MTPLHRTFLQLASLTALLGALPLTAADIGARYVELLAEAGAAEEYRFLDPLASVPDAPPAADTVEASKLSDDSRVTVIEAEPGVGKTTTLQILAWRHADKLLSGGNSGCRIPVYLRLKLLAHWKRTIEGAVRHELMSPDGTMGTVPWDSILLLLDGLNEVKIPNSTQ